MIPRDIMIYILDSMSTGDLPPGARERIKEEGGDGDNVKREDVSDQVASEIIQYSTVLSLGNVDLNSMFGLF